jgi:ubiquinone/menaquinone biosynthesis C-methylase UbiE
MAAHDVEMLNTSSWVVRYRTSNGLPFFNQSFSQSTLSATMTTHPRNAIANTTGRVLHGAVRYDLLLWLITGGREARFRERLLDLARLEPRECVLDVGCGTGTLAIAAKRRVGDGGVVHGIDASVRMLARARGKADRARVDVAFEHAAAEALPFPEARFDVALATVMLHHLPMQARQQCANEIRRVLKPAGRLLVVDFGGPSRERRSLIGHLHHHGHVGPADIAALVTAAGLRPLETGPVGVHDLQYVLAVRPIAGEA